ncbi:DUF742 domain-containing protein [Streptomyces sp. AJS327]|uniref:DUF742 domain-containing protein n=1 Tax=Streptomyces sp. AJS327 TaxID=2545265 RepID=UPI0015DDE0A0|nr:DUF742 domain-containing protein [Streptomyces sp. AJS327]MBA0052298.1 DUF742 domain-containing protein [Streptomyces sp. AJS327]
MPELPARASGPPVRRALLDGAAGRLARPYTASGGRTEAAAGLDLMTLVSAVGSAPPHDLGPDHVQLLDLCRGPVSVAELAARARQPVVVAKVLLSDLADRGAVVTRAPVAAPLGPDPTDRQLLEAVLDGLRRRL